MAGWSLENVRPKLDIVFGGENLRYKIQHPNALSPRVFIQHEGELRNEVREIVTALFPEGTYVDFIPGVSFPDSVEPVQLVRKPKHTRVGRKPVELASTKNTLAEPVRTPKKSRTRVD